MSQHGHGSTGGSGKRAKGEAHAAASSAGESDLFDRLSRLGELRDTGVLTDAEFEEQKARLLAVPSA